MERAGSQTAVRRTARVFALLLLPCAAVAAPSHGPPPIEHEQVAVDAKEDVTLSSALAGDIPAALDTPSGIVTAPDAKAPPSPTDTPYSPGSALDTAPDATFRPDRDTRRPDVLPYDDPFTPSTAPFKRLVAYDAVDATENLFVKDTALHAVAQRGQPASDGSEEQFYANLVVQLTPGRHVRIPSVGPGARVLKAHAIMGAKAFDFHLWRDGADNWFVDGPAAARGRVVMELSIPRATFGGFADAEWSEMGETATLPPRVARSAAEVAQHIGVSRSMRPRRVVEKMVEYFRGFSDSEDPPPSTSDVYKDLALSKKGVCRHRAFAFLVTSLGLGIPTRMVLNEAHAWVEVNDGTLWRRIDLGGAGHVMHEGVASSVPYEPPQDPFAWPAGASRGDEMADRAREEKGLPLSRSGSGRSNGQKNGGNNGANAVGPTSAPASQADDPNGEGEDQNGGASGDGGAGAGKKSGAGKLGANGKEVQVDERPRSTVTLVVDGADMRRAAPVVVHGAMTADGEACPHALVTIVLRDPRSARELVLGSLATGDDGAFAGSLVIPVGVPIGDYDAFARTQGDSRCGPGGP